MREFSRKYVFHIPLCEYDGDGLVEIDIDEILENLINRLNEKGFDSLYVTRVEGHYKSRRFDELLLTLSVMAMSLKPFSVIGLGITMMS